MAKTLEQLVTEIKDLQRQRRETQENIQQITEETESIKASTSSNEKRLAELGQQIEELTAGNTSLQEEVNQLEESITTLQKNTNTEIERINTECAVASAEAIKAYVHSCEARRTVTFDGIVFDLTDLRSAIAARTGGLPRTATLLLSGKSPTAVPWIDVHGSFPRYLDLGPNHQPSRPTTHTLGCSSLNDHSLTETGGRRGHVGFDPLPGLCHHVEPECHPHSHGRRPEGNTHSGSQDGYGLAFDGEHVSLVGRRCVFCLFFGGGSGVHHAPRG